MEWEADGVASGVQGLLYGSDGQAAEVEHAGGKDRVGAGRDGRGEVRELARSPAGDHRHGHRGPDGTDHRQVEPGPPAVGVH